MENNVFGCLWMVQAWVNFLFCIYSSIFSKSIINTWYVVIRRKAFFKTFLTLCKYSVASGSSSSNNARSCPYLLLPFTSHFLCSLFPALVIGGEVVGNFTKILEFLRWEHNFSNQNLCFIYFFIKVDPTEEKGVLHPFLPPRGDPCLLFATQAQELLLLLLSRVAHSPLLIFLFPLHIGSREEGGWRGNICVQGGNPVKKCT